MLDPIRKYNFRVQEAKVDPEVHKTPQARELKEACQQFESILWSQVWKKMRNSARAVGGPERERPWRQMEDLSLEMASDDLAASANGPGLWKMLYDRMVVGLAAERTSVSAERLAEVDTELPEALE